MKNKQNKNWFFFLIIFYACLSWNKRKARTSHESKKRKVVLDAEKKEKEPAVNFTMASGAAIERGII